MYTHSIRIDQICHICLYIRWRGFGIAQQEKEVTAFGPDPEVNCFTPAFKTSQDIPRRGYGSRPLAFTSESLENTTDISGYTQSTGVPEMATGTMIINDLHPHHPLKNHMENQRKNIFGRRKSGYSLHDSPLLAARPSP